MKTNCNFKPICIRVFLKRVYRLYVSLALLLLLLLLFLLLLFCCWFFCCFGVVCVCACLGCELANCEKPYVRFLTICKLTFSQCASSQHKHMQTHATLPLELYVTVFTKTVESEDELSMIVGGEQQKNVESEPGFNGFL